LELKAKTNAAKSSKETSLNEKELYVGGALVSAVYKPELWSALLAEPDARPLGMRWLRAGSDLLQRTCAQREYLLR
jgi:hypothetical protein